VLTKVLTGGFLLLMVGAVVIGGISLFNGSLDAHAWQGGGRNERAIAARGADNQVAPDGQGRGRGSQGAGANARTDEAMPGGQSRGGGGQRTGSNARTGEVVSSGQGGGRGSQGGQGGQGTGAEGRTDKVGSDGSSGRGQGQGNSQSSRAEPQAEVADWQTIEGVVVETEELVIETADGQTVQVGLGQSQYRESQGFVLQVGDSVRVSG